MKATRPTQSDPLNDILKQFDRVSEKSHNMANLRDICALMEYPEPYQFPKVYRKLRCVYTGRNIVCNINFDNLTLERMIIYENQLWAIDDRKYIVAFDVVSGEKVHEIMFPRGIGVGLTIFRDKMFAYSTYELFEIKQLPGTNTKALVLEAIFPHEIFALLIQRRDETQISFAVETQRGKIIEAVVANRNVARCRLLKSDNHFLSGVYGSHVFVYCLDSNDIVDSRNNIIERNFPPERDEMLCRFRMSQDGVLYYCCWDEIDEPWTIVSLNAVTGNRRFYPTDSNHIYMIPCARFVPVYEDD